MGKLTWHDGALPEWLKLSGDKEGGSFKMIFETAGDDMEDCAPSKHECIVIFRASHTSFYGFFFAQLFPLQ